jgi:hypothetical protein
MYNVLPRPRRRIVLIVSALAAAGLAAGASPANAATSGSAQKSTDCLGWEANVETFSSLKRLAPAHTARGVNDRSEKNTSAYSGDTQIPAGSEPATSSSFTATVPVYFHVVTDGRTGSVSKATVKDQINVLNLSFAGFYGGANTGFRFELKGLDYTDNAAWFAQETFADEVAMKSALKKGGATSLNIYSTSGGGFLGWAYYPSIVKYQHYEFLDGVVVHYGSLPGGFLTRFNRGYTATHEVGHYFGLAHTFEFGCQGYGDYVDDTPEMSVPTSGCPVGKDTCPAPGLDPIHNYMDYSDDPCYNQFTAGQATRAQQQYLFWRVKKGYHQN